MRSTILFLLALLPLYADSNVLVHPMAARPGEAFQLQVTFSPCSPEDEARLPDPTKPNPVSFSGSGIEADWTKAKVTKCSLSVPVNVADTATYTERSLLVMSKKQGEELVNIPFAIEGLPPGPIPPGLNPKVDVMWNILSEKNCADQFGNRVAARFYCIEVSLGNNSGYALLLSAVGFARQFAGLTFPESTSSYRNVRSVVQKEQLVSGRNFTLRSLQAAGIMIAGFTPFSGNAGRRGRIGLWSQLVGGIAATAFDGLVPDHTVRQYNNLDDAALRDGLLVPNNSPRRFSIFVDREALKPYLLSKTDRMAYERELLDQRLQDVSAAVRDLEATGRTGSREYGMLKGEQTRMQDAIGKPAAGANPPKVQPAADQGRKSSALNVISRKRAPFENDILAVRLALGRLIVVGDAIEFRDRIKIDANAVNPEAPLQTRYAGVQGGEHLKQGKVTEITLLGTQLHKSRLETLNCPAAECTVTYTPGAEGTLAALKADLKATFVAKELKIRIVPQFGDPIPVTIPVDLEKPTVTATTMTPAKITENTKQTLAIKLDGTFLAGLSVKATHVSKDGATTAKLTPAKLAAAPATASFEVEITAAQAVVDAKLEIEAETPGGAVAKITIKLEK